MNDLMTTSNEALTMNSLEIAAAENTVASTMTLKEITDLLGVRHDKAMLKVAEMANEPEFGLMSKMDISYEKGQGALGLTKTYQLDKRQSIAVAAHLNTALLMRIVDRWQELETAKPTQHALDAHAYKLITAGILPGMVEWLDDVLVNDKLDFHKASADRLFGYYLHFCREFFHSGSDYGEGQMLIDKNSFMASITVLTGNYRCGASSKKPNHKLKYHFEEKKMQLNGLESSKFKQLPKF